MRTAYYRSTVARLHNFDGKAVVPAESIVIYELIYQSDAQRTVAGTKLPRVKIFEYLDPGEP